MPSPKLKLTREKTLQAIPLKNEMAEWNKNEQGEVVINLKRTKAWWVKLLAKIFYLPRKKTVVLDEIGTFVWDRCDGSRSVEKIVEEFREKYKLNRKEAEVSLLSYLQQLGKRKLIGFVIKGVKDE